MMLLVGFATVLPPLSAPFFADQAPVARSRNPKAGRDAAPSGVPARLYRAGGEGTRLCCALCAPAGVSAALHRGFSCPEERFFGSCITPPFLWRA